MHTLTFKICKNMKKEKGKEQEMLKQNVGIDVSKDDVKVALSVLSAELRVATRGSRTFPNTEKGFAALRAWVESKKVAGLEVHYTMEATGVYYEGLAYFLSDQGSLVHVALPNHARKYGQSLGVKSKTDRIDALTLAQLGLERTLRRWQPLSPPLRQLRQLTREREALIRARTTGANLLHAYRHQGKPHPAAMARAQEHISFLDGQVKQIEREVKKLTQQEKELQPLFGYLQSIPGVGLLTAAVVVAETNGFAAFSSAKQLVSYAGLDVKLAESGRWKGQSKISKRGNSYLRKALYMPALTKIRTDAATNAFYERLKQRKGKPMVAVVAVERKLLALLYTLWKKQEMFAATPAAG
jgi:transposase